LALGLALRSPQALGLTLALRSPQALGLTLALGCCRTATSASTTPQPDAEPQLPRPPPRSPTPNRKLIVASSAEPQAARRSGCPCTRFLRLGAKQTSNLQLGAKQTNNLRFGAGGTNTPRFDAREQPDRPATCDSPPRQRPTPSNRTALSRVQTLPD
jgi:hypothetical protein